MLVEDCVLFQMAKCCRAAPPHRSVTLYSQACACERSRKASPPRGSRSLPRAAFHLIFQSLRCQRESERSAELSVTELRLRERLSGSVVEISDEST
jgi:hypothetical protein